MGIGPSPTASKNSPNPPRGADGGGGAVLDQLAARLAQTPSASRDSRRSPWAVTCDGAGLPLGMMARLFALTVLVYPLALALLCAGAGLLVDRCSGSFLPAALVPVVGAAALIALSQLTTYIPGIARSTPYVIAAAA